MDSGVVFWSVDMGIPGTHQGHRQQMERIGLQHGLGNIVWMATERGTGKMEGVHKEMEGDLSAVAGLVTS